LEASKNKSNQIFIQALQELEWMKRPPNYENPFTSTDPNDEYRHKKKPRKRLSRGPRLSGGEL